MADPVRLDRYADLLCLAHLAGNHGVGGDSGGTDQCISFPDYIEPAEDLGVHFLGAHAGPDWRVALPGRAYLPGRPANGPRVRQNSGVEPAHLLELRDDLGHWLLRGIPGVTVAYLVGFLKPLQVSDYECVKVKKLVLLLIALSLPTPTVLAAEQQDVDFGNNRVQRWRPKR